MGIDNLPATCFLGMPRRSLLGSFSSRATTWFTDVICLIDTSTSSEGYYKQIRLVLNQLREEFDDNDARWAFVDYKDFYGGKTVSYWAYNDYRYGCVVQLELDREPRHPSPSPYVGAEFKEILNNMVYTFGQWDAYQYWPDITYAKEQYLALYKIACNYALVPPDPGHNTGVSLGGRAFQAHGGGFLRGFALGNRIIIWIGEKPGWNGKYAINNQNGQPDPLFYYPTHDDTVLMLKRADIKVIAVGIGINNAAEMDMEHGQAQRIATETGGAYLPTLQYESLVAAINSIAPSPYPLPDPPPSGWVPPEE